MLRRSERKLLGMVDWLSWADYFRFKPLRKLPRLFQRTPSTSLPCLVRRRVCKFLWWSSSGRCSFNNSFPIGNSYCHANGLVVSAALQHRLISVAPSAYLNSRQFVSKPRLIFLHFARKTFNPWAGLKTVSRSAAGHWTARSVPDWGPGRRHWWPSAMTGGRGILSRGLRRAAQTVLQRGGWDDGHVHQL